MHLSSTMLQVKMPKTGCTHASSVHYHHGGGRQIKGLGGHDPVWYVPIQERAHLTTWGTVRSPWSWYCSLFAHCWLNGEHHRRELEMWGNGSRKFRDVLYGWTHPGEVEQIPHSVFVVAGAFDKSSRWLVANGRGLASWGTLYFYGEADARKKDLFPAWSWGTDLLIPTDRLDDGLVALFGDVARKPIEERKNTLPLRRKQRSKEVLPYPDDYREWYDAEMLEWVAKADEDLITFGGWPGPWQPAPQPIVET